MIIPTIWVLDEFSLCVSIGGSLVGRLFLVDFMFEVESLRVIVYLLLVSHTFN